MFFVLPRLKLLEKWRRLHLGGPMIAYESPIFDQKRSGAYFTPRDVAQTLVKWALRHNTDRLLDPSCGDGEFIAIHPNSVGIEQNPISAGAAVAAAPSALVHNGDFFAWAGETSERFECAVGNPPFIRYQSFNGEVRQRALSLCARNGAHFSGLTSSWAPFLVATAHLLSPGGRMAFVVPAEIGHATYAAPLLEYLVASFSEVQIIAVRDKLFPSLSEDCWLLYAGGRGGSARHIGFTVCDHFKPSATRPKSTVSVDIEEWRTVWSRRLRPYLLPRSVRELYTLAAEDSESTRLGDIANVGIGYVSGDNDFFHLRPSEARRWKIPKELLHPSLRNSRDMPEQNITTATVQSWKEADQKVLLLRLGRDQDIPSSVQQYLDSNAGKEARLGYKCRKRTPWFAVPDVQVPDFVLSYMSGRSANLVRNLAGVTCTNSVHSVRVRNWRLAERLFPLWTTSFVRLSCEIEGHALGGGMLKLEPREARQVLFPSEEIAGGLDDDALMDSVNTMQRWRHYAH